MTNIERFWVQLAALSVAAVCIAAVLAIAVRRKRLTGNWPEEITGSVGEPGWFSLAAFVFLWSHGCISAQAMRHFPLSVLYPGLDMALLIGFAALAARAFVHVFDADWHWPCGLWISRHSVWTALFSYAIYFDVKVFSGMPWVWVPAALIAVLAAPYCARFAYQEMIRSAPAAGEAKAQSESKLWRPGGPR